MIIIMKISSAIPDELSLGLGIILRNVSLSEASSFDSWPVLSSKRAVREASSIIFHAWSSKRLRPEAVIFCRRRRKRKIVKGTAWPELLRLENSLVAWANRKVAWSGLDAFKIQAQVMRSLIVHPYLCNHCRSPPSEKLRKPSSICVVQDGSVLVPSWYSRNGSIWRKYRTNISLMFVRRPLSSKARAMFAFASSAARAGLCNAEWASVWERSIFFA